MLGRWREGRAELAWHGKAKVVHQWSRAQAHTFFYVNNKTSYGVALVVVLVVVLVGSEGSHVHLLGMKLCWLLVAGKCTRDQFPGLPVH